MRDASQIEYVGKGCLQANKSDVNIEKATEKTNWVAENIIVIGVNCMLTLCVNSRLVPAK